MKQKRRAKNDSGQINMSFGMIFSIIMIVLFISVAFYAIQKFLSLQNSTQVAKFGNDLQNDINNVWKSSQSSQQVSYFLPSKILKVCFIDYDSGSSGSDSDYYNELKILRSGDENLFFYPIGSAEGLDSKELKNVNIEATTSAENPLCIDNANGKVSVRLKKEFAETLVTITR